jgi:hypothetical protein
MMIASLREMGLGGLRPNCIPTPLYVAGLRHVRGTGTAGIPAGLDVTGLVQKLKRVD